MANKLGIYWSAPGRQFRRTRSEMDGDIFVCPRCKGQMVKKVYKHVDDGGKAHLLVCPNSECLFLVKYDNIQDAPSKQVNVVEVPDVESDDAGLVQMEGSPEAVTAKVASVNLQTILEESSAKFAPDFIDDDILELKSKFGFPKTVYVNSDGDVWSDDAEKGVFKAISTDDVQKKIRELTASKDDVFSAKELMQVFACECGNPLLDEAAVQLQGDEIVGDMLNEPEIIVLDLSPENQNQLAQMVFDSLLNAKEQDLETFEPHLANKLASYLNGVFENLVFLDLGNGSIKVTFDNKLAHARPSRQELIDLLKTASEGVDLTDFYQQTVTDFSKKVSEKLPDYFSLRKEVVSEVLEQINGNT